MSDYTEDEWRRMDQLIAVHVFGYRWFHYKGRPSGRFDDHDVALPEIKPFCTLQVPAPWQERHELKQVPCPAPDDVLDIDIPFYHAKEEQVPKLLEKLLKEQLRHILTYNPKHGYCCGESGFFPTIAKALVAHIIDVLNLKIYPTYGCSRESTEKRVPDGSHPSAHLKV